MARYPLQRMFPLVGSSAASKHSRASSGDTATEQVNIPQSQPMQRTISQTSDSDDSDCSQSPSPTSDEEPLSDSASTITPSIKSPDRPSHIPPEGLHDPPKATDDVLIRVAELLSESICQLDEGWHFTPSPDEPDLLSYDFDEEQSTVLCILSLVKRASLPLETFLLAALIIQRLKPEFYDEWYHLLNAYQPMYEEERTREIVVVAAIIIAQKFLHDAIYTLTTWSDIVCVDRDDLHRENLHTTERLILSHISWRINLIADAKTVSDMAELAYQDGSSAYERYSKFLPPPITSLPDSRADGY